MHNRIGPASFDYYLNIGDMRALRKENDAFGWIMSDRSNPRYSYRIFNGTLFIKSYDTVVACIPADMEQPIPMEKVTRLWSGWSTTTMNHIARFIGYRIPKDTWFAMPVGSDKIAVTYWCGHAIVHAR